VVTWRARSDLGLIHELANSIAEVDQIQPIVVMPIADGKDRGKYELVAGFRRMRACEQLQRPVIAMVRTPKDALQSLAIQLHENMRRKDFDMLEQSEGLRRYKQIYEQTNPETVVGAAGRGRSKEKLAAAAGKDAAAPRFTQVASAATAIPERKIFEMLEVGKLPAKYFREIKGAKTTADRNRLIQDALRKVRAERKTEKLREAAEANRQLEISEAKKPPVVIHCADHRRHPALKAEGYYDLCLTDPPYERERSLIGHIARSSLGKMPDWDKLDLGWVLRVAPALAKGGQILAFCPLEAVGAYELAFEAAKLEYRAAIVWHKTNPGTVHRSTYLPSVEAIVWASKPGKAYTFLPWEEQGGAVAHNLIEGPICGGNERVDHPTQKPLWIIMRLLQRHAVEGQRILDPFAGSGTTLVAARKLGLEAVGIEREEKYVELARLRLQARGGA